MEVGKKYFGFTLVEEKQMDEINSVGRLFEHTKTGARLFHIENDDDNKVFCISFRTPPEDNTGLPHILEHSVLCGSRKYPVKDPFVELAKGSLNTFLNAMTYSDKTMYPVASRNEQDFRNLMDVYMDAVFFPNIYKSPEILKQEGWHYDMDSVEGDITYKGVVYNEMKGAFSSPEQVLFRGIGKSLFPDNPYQYESGGDPEFIPELTQDQFQEFHRKYYHPSNSYIFIYGDGPIEEYLEYMDKEYLSLFNREVIDSSIPDQKPFAELQDQQLEYSIASNEDENNKAYLSYNVVVGHGDDPLMHYALDIVEHILLETPGAPLKQALIDAGIGQDVFGSSDTAVKQPYLSVVAKGANKEDRQKFIDIIENTLKDLVKKGIDKKEIEAAINKFEFKLREADYGRYPKGLMYCIISMSTWLYDHDPMMLLCYDDIFAKLKEALTNDFIERFIEEHLINNTHKSMMILQPEKGLNGKKEQIVKEHLAKMKESLDKDGLQRIVDQTKHLLAYQQEPSDKEALETIPLLKLDEIDKESQIPHMEVEMSRDTKILYHPDFTNQIGYMNLYFDINRVDKEDLPYVGLLSALLGKMSTEQYHYGALSNEINIYTGGIEVHATTYSKQKNPDGFDGKMVVQGKAFYSQLPKLFTLIEEIIQHTKLDDKNRIKEIVNETKSRMQMNMVSGGHNVASMRAQSYFSPAFAMKDAIQGVTYFEFLKDMAANFDGKVEEVISKLKQVTEEIFNIQTLTVGFTCEEDSKDEVLGNIQNFMEKLNDKALAVKEIKFDLTNKNEGFLTPDKIQYVAKAGNFIKAGYEYTGLLPLLNTVLSTDFLWNRVRVMGGAYGCMCNFSRSGNAYFVSYRDPNLQKTLDIYGQIAEYVKEFTCDDRELVKYIIGTISRIDSPMTPAMKGNASFDRYFMNIAPEDIQLTRKTILEAKLDELRGLSDLVAAVTQDDVICVQGNEEKIEEHKELFKNLIHLFS